MIPPMAHTPLLYVYNSHPPVACCRGGEHKDSALASVARFITANCHCLTVNGRRLTAGCRRLAAGLETTHTGGSFCFFVCNLKDPRVCASFSARGPDARTDFEAEQADELEALEAICNDNLQTLAPGHWLITLSRYNADCVLRMQLDVECPPRSPPRCNSAP